jgi:hypothetical protein
MHNTLTDRVAVVTSIGLHSRNDRAVVASPESGVEHDWVWDLMLPENRWYTNLPHEYRNYLSYSDDSDGTLLPKTALFRAKPEVHCYQTLLHRYTATKNSHFQG